MAALVIPLLFVAMLALAFVQPRTALLTALFFVAWSGLEVDVGLRVTGYQLVMAPLCLGVLLRTLHSAAPLPTVALGLPFVAMLLYAIVNSTFQIGFLPETAIASGALRGPTVRAIIQIFLHVFSLAPLLMVPPLMKGPEDATTVLRLWMTSLVVLAVIGWLQLVIWYGTGTNPLPTGTVNRLLGGSVDMLREGRFDFEGFGIYRMNSLANEPRNLGTALALGLVGLQAWALAVRDLPGRKMAALWLFLFVSAAATFSTSFAAVWLIGTVALFPAFWITRTPIARSTASILGTLAALLVPLLLAIAGAEAAGIPVLDLLAERTIDRLEDIGPVEDFDLAISGWLAANPDRLWFGGGIGNAHLYAMPYLDPEHAAYAEGQVFLAKTLLLRLISEQGIIGLLLLLLFVLAAVLRAAPARHIAPRAVFAPLALALLAMNMASAQLVIELWFLLGTLVLVARPYAAATPQRPLAPA